MRVYVVLEDGDTSFAPDSRLDILHQCLLVLHDSPLNKDSNLRVYVRTKGNELIEINPSLSVPRTLDLFTTLMDTLVKNRKIKSANSGNILMKMIPNKLESVLPANSYSVGFSTTGKLVKLSSFLSSYDFNRTLVVHVGTTSSDHSKGTTENVDEVICISEHPLSAAHCLSKLTTELLQLI
ncbi:rRNA small subunit pseudouridine methyltransferase Nep1 [Theileria orientalis]|uniref:rRNA small subunit pseudouridine methyltransferase Nep1 n=1 Tax=Theileria orientalis TaxID=68886 RepID=A0A976M422_THEOR|nr:rRNA small subunit pseudouridine methyltransferase Nep1 [Theileria orientalis]